MKTFKQWLNINEIKTSTSLIKSTHDYDKFIDWAKSEADKITQNKEKFSNYEFQWSESPNNVKLITYEKGEPLGYVGLEKFEDGYKVMTLGVKPQARGKGLASVMYDYIISKTKLYSDEMQTPEAKILWLKLSKKYNVKGYNKTFKKTFEVIPQGNELVSLDPSFTLYSDEINDNFLVVSK
jgi:GNAT superfamily N-acetyltransferase